MCMDCHSLAIVLCLIRLRLYFAPQCYAPTFFWFIFVQQRQQHCQQHPSHNDQRDLSSRLERPIKEKKCFFESTTRTSLLSNNISSERAWQQTRVRITAVFAVGGFLEASVKIKGLETYMREKIFGNKLWCETPKQYQLDVVTIMMTRKIEWSHWGAV